MIFRDKLRIALLVSVASVLAACATTSADKTGTAPMTGKRAAAIGPQEKVGMDPALISSEGMWRPDQLPGLAPELKALGLELPPKDLADLTRHPMNAVI